MNSGSPSIDSVCELLAAAPDASARETLGNVGLSTLYFGLMGRWGADCVGYVPADASGAEVLEMVEPFRLNRVDSDGNVGRVRLSPVDESAFPALYRASLDPESGYRWRFRGATPDFGSFVQTLFAGTKAQFLVTGVDGHVYGLVAAYSDQADLGHCYIAFLRCSQRRSNGEMYEGMFLFVEYLFSTTPYRKLYAEVPEYNDSVMGLSSTAQRGATVMAQVMGF
ncbi:MAG: hypothetical protein KDB86_05755 [Actinobacteria bacterium]|nr:hypothetical protein [Actinomycetota bacterium]